MSSRNVEQLVILRQKYLNKKSTIRKSTYLV
jgi:hypothetical protein